MAFNDALSDMLARIKNAHSAKKSSTSCFKSKLNINVLNVLKEEGYIRDFKYIEERQGVSSIKIELKYYNFSRYNHSCSSCCGSSSRSSWLMFGSEMSLLTSIFRSFSTLNLALSSLDFESNTDSRT